jgi:DEAD/DEAH box helicase domain-containing protein
MKKIVFDIETRNIFQDVGTNNPEDLDISVVCTYDYVANEFRSFLQEDFSKLWELIETADMLITFNGDHFDIPLLNKYYRRERRGDLSKIRSLDILKEIKNSYGRRMKLDQIAEGTLGTKKSGNGLEAIVWWRNGEVDKIIKYCTDDVRITRDVYEYAKKNNLLKFKEGPFTKEIKLDTKHWEPEEVVKTQSLFSLVA